MGTIKRTHKAEKDMKLGQRNRAYIIAEIGSNHDGDLERAKKLMTLAKESGADAAKFQSFQADNLIRRSHPAWEVLNKLSLPDKWHKILKEHGDTIGIDFLSTPFDLERLRLLVDVGVPAIKIASGDLTYLELLEAAALTKKPVILSVGHAAISEVDTAVQTLLAKDCQEMYLLQCISLYPSQAKNANLKAMRGLAERFCFPVGYSDHSPGSLVAIGAVALGASVIEKHFTDDSSRKGPDHAFAMTPALFKSMVEQIREMEEALGDYQKKPLPEESEERIMARRAIYSMRPLKKGTHLTRQDVKVVRQAYEGGVTADNLDEVVGKILTADIDADTMITWKMIGEPS
jgi:sialic acid synthase SpsE